MKNSGLLKPKAAFYMFGGDAIASKRSKAFQTGFGPWGDSLFWRLYESFCDEMEEWNNLYQRKKLDPKELRF